MFQCCLSRGSSLVKKHCMLGLLVTIVRDGCSQACGDHSTLSHSPYAQQSYTVSNEMSGSHGGSDACASTTDGSSLASTSRRTVIIVGSGLSGLVSCMNLLETQEEALAQNPSLPNLDVHVVEAADVAGGRLFNSATDVDLGSPLFMQPWLFVEIESIVESAVDSCKMYMCTSSRKVSHRDSSPYKYLL